MDLIVSVSEFTYILSILNSSKSFACFWSVYVLPALMPESVKMYNSGDSAGDF